MALAYFAFVFLAAVGQRTHLAKAEVPFQLTGNEVVAKFSINGRGPYTAFLDTGTSPSVIDIDLARRLGLQISSGAHEGSGGGTGASRFSETSLPKVGLGGVQFANVDALAGSLASLGRKFGQPIHAVLGDSLFIGKVVQFDYPGRTVRFLTKPLTTKQALDSVTLPFRHIDGEVRLVGLRINGRQVDANLDTGSNAFFSLTPRGIRKLGLGDQVSKAPAKRSAGFNGSYEVRTGKLRIVQIGNISVQSQAVGFWLLGTGHDDTPWDVNVGNAFLRHYVVTIDYRKMLVTFAKR